MSTIDREEAIRIIASYPGPVDKSVVRRLLTQMQSQNAMSIHEVAELLAELFGDDCACNVNGNDEWLPKFCGFATTTCPYPGGANCWESFLKYRKERINE